MDGLDNHIVRIQVFDGSCDFFFEDSNIPRTISEFNPGSPTRKWLEAIQDLIYRGPVED